LGLPLPLRHASRFAEQFGIPLFVLHPWDRLVFSLSDLPPPLPPTRAGFFSHFPPPTKSCSSARAVPFGAHYMLPILVIVPGLSVEPRYVPAVRTFRVFQFGVLAGLLLCPGIPLSLLAPPRSGVQLGASSFCGFHLFPPLSSCFCLVLFFFFLPVLKAYCHLFLSYW